MRLGENARPHANTMVRCPSRAPAPLPVSPTRSNCISPRMVDKFPFSLLPCRHTERFRRREENAIHDWAKVVTEPLGLAGFALFLVFGVLSRLKAKDERRWLGPLAAAMAVIALAGGLLLAYLKAGTTLQPASTIQPPQTQTNTVQQTTTGKGSPIVQGVQGDVTVNVDQSEGTQAKHKSASTPAKKPVP